MTDKKNREKFHPIFRCFHFDKLAPYRRVSFARAWTPIAIGAAMLLPGCGGPGGSGPASGLDVAVMDLAIPAQAQAGGSVEVAATVENHGTIPASPAVMFVLSSDSEIAVTDALLTLSLPKLIFNPGESLRVKATVTLFDNLASGTYSIGAIAPPNKGEVTPNDNFTGQSFDLSGVSCTPDMYEPDDAPGAAQPITLVSPQRHNFCEDDSDWMSFDATAGATYSFLVTDCESAAGMPLLLLFNESSPDPLAMLEPDAKTELATWTAPASGHYRLLAATRTGLHGTGIDTGYTIVVGDDRPDLVAAQQFGPGGGKLYPGDILYLSVDASVRGVTSPGKVELGVYMSQDAAVTTSDTPLRLIQSDTATWTGSLQLAAGVPANLAAGSYYAAMIADPNNTVAELLESNNISEAQPFQITALPCTPDAFEPDDFETQATLLVLQQSQTHDLCDDRVDWFSLNLTGGTDYRFLFEKKVSFDIEMELFDAAGSPLGITLHDGSSWKPPSDGTYLLKVRPVGGTTYDPRGGEEEYTLTLLPAVADLAATKLDPWAGLYVGGQNPVDVEITNLGGESASGFTVSVHLSPDANVTPGDLKLAEKTSVSLGWTANQRKVGYQFTVSVPGNTPPGAYYLGFLVDTGQAVSELDEMNNVLVMPVMVQ